MLLVSVKTTCTRAAVSCMYAWQYLYFFVIDGFYKSQGRRTYCPRLLCNFDSSLRHRWIGGTPEQLAKYP
jgi:hypothetical protein